jgi:hypothetical protein
MEQCKLEFDKLCLDNFNLSPFLHESSQKSSVYQQLIEARGIFQQAGILCAWSAFVTVEILMGTLRAALFPRLTPFFALGIFWVWL